MGEAAQQIFILAVLVLWGSRAVPNERISFTTFINQSAPAVTRWKERETECLTSLPQPEYVSRLEDLNGRAQPTPVPSRSGKSTSTQPMLRKPSNFGEVFTVWRLISGNHRELARGAGMFPGYLQAAAHAQRVRDDADLLAVTFMRHRATGELGWYGSLGARPVIFAAAWHRTARERDRAASSALLALRGAKITAVAVKHGHRHLSDTAVGVAAEWPLP